MLQAPTRLWHFVLLLTCPSRLSARLLSDYDKVDVPALEASEDQQPHPVRRWRANRNMTEPLTAHQARVARAAYLGLCEHFDVQVGKVRKELGSTANHDPRQPSQTRNGKDKTMAPPPRRRSVTWWTARSLAPGGATAVSPA